MSNEELISLAKAVASSDRQSESSAIAAFAAALEAETTTAKSEPTEVKPAEQAKAEVKAEVNPADPLGWDSPAESNCIEALIRWRWADGTQLNGNVRKLTKRMEGVVAFPAIGRSFRLEALPRNGGLPPAVRVMPRATAYCRDCGAMSVTSVIKAVRDAKASGATGKCSAVLQDGKCPMCGGHAWVTDLTPECGDRRLAGPTRRVTRLLNGRTAPHVDIEKKECAKLLQWFDAQPSDDVKQAVLPILVSLWRLGDGEKASVPKGFECFESNMAELKARMTLWRPGSQAWLPSPKAARGKIDYAEFLDAVSPEAEGGDINAF